MLLWHEQYEAVSPFRLDCPFRRRPSFGAILILHRKNNTILSERGLIEIKFQRTLDFVICGDDVSTARTRIFARFS